MFLGLLLLILTRVLASNGQGQCETITLKECIKDLPYNETKMPNFLDHPSQDVATVQSRSLMSFSNVCGINYRNFLCSMYVPVCTVLPEAVPPCRFTCTVARRNCEHVLNEAGIQWPDHLECSKFPVSGLCVNFTGNLKLKTFLMLFNMVTHLCHYFVLSLCIISPFHMALFRHFV